MANVTAKMVKELRDSTGAGMLDCKKALVEADGNMDKAVDILREKGLSKAAKKADRVAAEGLVAIEINEDNTVASMVVFQNGLPKKTAYRKFKIKSTEGKPDDFLSMKEVLSRRLSRLGEPKWEKPDLIIIDGGKGQLSSVMQIVEDLGIKVGKDGIDFVSLAKREEEVFLPYQSDSILLPRESNALYLIQRIRDEAHRFAITFHRDLRSKKLKEG